MTNNEDTFELVDNTEQQSSLDVRELIYCEIDMSFPYLSSDTET